jgi:hydrogenase nickel incorporation protein HypA/HybF
MHELSIAQNILEIVRDALPQGHGNVSSVKVRIGDMAGVVPDSLTFCFSALTAGTPLQGASLDIERVPLKARCRACGGDNVLGEFIFVCPSCGSNELQLLSGRELEVAAIEVEDGACP